MDFNQNNLAELARAVLDIAQEAGKAILDIYQQDFDVEYKADDSPLTVADKTSNDIINRQLAALPVVLPIISEENDDVPYAQRKAYKYYWLVDPLDGTKEFVDRNGEFAVNIALVHHQKPILGVVWVPVTEGGYWAWYGGGSYSIFNGVEKKLNCSTFKLTDKGLRVPVSRSHLTDATKELIAQFDTPQLLPLGSALKFIRIAEGAADIYPRIGTTMEWDTAATQIIIEEAGGVIVDFETRTPLVYNKPNLSNPDFLAFGRLAD